MKLPEQQSSQTTLELEITADSPSVAKGPPKFGGVRIEYKQSRDILTRGTGFMDAYDFTLNPYTGCAFGCTYCYAAFFSHSTEDREAWGEWVRVKENAIDLLRKRRVGSLDGKRIYMSSVTDPYQPIERKLNLTRDLLGALAEHHRPKLVVQTRSPDVVRDADLFKKIVSRGGRVQVNLTVTTDDEDVRRAFEPSCPSNARRLTAVEMLAQRGVDTCVTMTPLLLVRDAGLFAENLKATGVKEFIIQPFHFRRGKFVAGTRDVALGILAEKFDCDPIRVPSYYLKHYHRIRDVLLTELPRVGQGKKGFKPPF